MTSTSLSRFIQAQNGTFEDALREIRAGRKLTHWMWFVFPQVAGMATSEKSSFFAIEGVKEARAYIDHPVLGHRLVTATRAVMQHSERALVDIFPWPDDLKFISCMTLFASLTDAPPEFDLAIDQFASGRRDLRTIELLERD